MNKDLILITAYCPNKEKKEILFDFLKQLQKFRDKYDVLVSSHTPLDIHFFDYFDYFYYDRNNVILTDLEYRQNGFFCPFDNYVIWSSYIGSGNTIKAILDLLIPSIAISEKLILERSNSFPVALIPLRAIAGNEKGAKVAAAFIALSA